MVENENGLDEDNINKVACHLPLQCNKSIRNFIIVKHGIIDIWMIHPKYKELVCKNGELMNTNDTIKYIQNHKFFIKKSLCKEDVMYIPNYWIYLITSNNEKEAIFEFVGYKTPLI